jgi:hypothetical protein
VPAGIALEATVRQSLDELGRRGDRPAREDLGDGRLGSGRACCHDTKITRGVNAEILKAQPE